MATPLTLAQTILIGTKNNVKPWKASALRPTFGPTNRSLSMVAVRDKIQSRKVLMIVAIRNSSIIVDSRSHTDFEANSKSGNPAYVPTQAGLQIFIATLKKNDISVLKISKDWRTAALSGTMLAFASVPSLYFTMTGQATSGAAGSISVQGGASPTTQIVGGGVVVVAGSGLVAVGAGATGVAGGGATAAGGVGAAGGFTFSGLAAADGALSGVAGSAFFGGPVGWAALIVGGLLVAAGVYLIETGLSSSKAPPPATLAPTSSNDAEQGYQSGDGTEVYGVTSEADAAVATNALGGLSGVDASALPSGPNSDLLSELEGLLDDPLLDALLEG
jgi:hypothetical protein